MKILEFINASVWGVPMLVMVLGAGIFFTLAMRGIQLRKLPFALCAMVSESGGEKGELSPFKSACVALAATIGTGNIIGVTSAILIGGSGAIFWMWVSTMLCIPLRFAEGYLGCKYARGEKGGVLSGAFLYIERVKAPFMKFSAMSYAFCCLASSLLGMGTMVQSRSIADAVTNLFGVSGTEGGFYLAVGCGFLTALLAALAIRRGLSSIGNTTALLVPIMLILYCACGIGAILFFGQALPAVLSEILECAFRPRAVLGGAAAITVRAAMRAGISRGIFTNESGLGTGAFAAGVSAGSPFKAGCAQMGVVFIDTIVVCSVTALAVLCSGSIAGGGDAVAIVCRAFSLGGVLPLGRVLVPLCLVLFSFTSSIGVYFYGYQSLRYLTGGYGKLLYNNLYIMFLFLGSVLPVGAIWCIADIANGMLAFAHIPALLCLAPIVIVGAKEGVKNILLTKKASLS